MIKKDMDMNSDEIIPKLIDYVYNTSKCSKAQGGEQLQWRFAIGFRRFVALSWIMRPATVANDVPAWKVAEAIGISPGGFARICRQISKDLGGLKHPSMRKDSHCKACSQARKGVAPTTEGRRSKVNTVANTPANRYRASEQQGVSTAIESFRSGKSWTKKQVRLLFAVGYIDADGVLTARGVKEVQAIQI